MDQFFITVGVLFSQTKSGFGMTNSKFSHHSMLSFNISYEIEIDQSSYYEEY